MVTSVQASTLKSLSTLCIFVALVFITVEGSNTTVGNTTIQENNTTDRNTTPVRSNTTERPEGGGGDKNGITCVQCFGPTCQLNPETCGASFDCFNSVQLHTSPDNTEMVIPGKGCSSGVCIPMEFSITLGSGQRLGTQYQCCNSGNCNKETLEMPPTSKEENGLSCPACYTEEGSDCNPQPLKCTGTETVCVEAEVTRAFPGTPPLKTSGKGCATESSCLVNSDKINSFLTLKITCIKAATGSAPPMPIILSTLTILLLLRVLL